MVKEEIKRILCGRFVYLLLAGALVINLWILWNFREQKEIVDTSRSLKENGTEYVNTQNMEEIISAFDIAEEGRNGEYRIRNMVEGAVYLTDRLSAANLADSYISFWMLNGQAAEYARKAFGSLEGVLQKNRQVGTASQFFVPCSGSFFDLFSRWLPYACTLEAVLAAVLLMMRGVNEPFDTGTKSVVLASKTGRKISRIRGFASLMVSIGLAACIWLATYLLAEAVYQMGILWNTGIGSSMVLDSFFPILSRFPMNILGYTVLQFGMCLCITAVFAGMAYVFVMSAHKTVTAFARMAFACAAAAVFTQLFPRDNLLFFVFRFNPVDFVQKAGHWFVSGGTFLSVRYYEIGMVLFWGAVTAYFFNRRNKKFIKEDIV